MKKGKTKMARQISKIAILPVLFLIGVLCLAVGVIANEKTAFADGETYTDRPVITVLLHGLGGSPLDWTNNDTSFSATIEDDAIAYFTASGFSFV